MISGVSCSSYTIGDVNLSRSTDVRHRVKASPDRDSTGDSVLGGA